MSEVQLSSLGAATTAATAGATNGSSSADSRTNSEDLTGVNSLLELGPQMRSVTSLVNLVDEFGSPKPPMHTRCGMVSLPHLPVPLGDFYFDSNSNSNSCKSETAAVISQSQQHQQVLSNSNSVRVPSFVHSFESLAANYNRLEAARDQQQQQQQMQNTSQILQQQQQLLFEKESSFHQEGTNGMLGRTVSVSLQTIAESAKDIVSPSSMQATTTMFTLHLPTTIKSRKHVHMGVLLAIKCLSQLSFVEFLNISDVCSFKLALQHRLSPEANALLSNHVNKLVWCSNSPPISRELWNTFASIPALELHFPTTFKDFCERASVEERNIGLDVDRTFPDCDFFQIEENQAKLTRVLRALSQSIKEIGYMQGWNSIGGVFLLQGFSEETTFWILNNLMHKQRLKEIFLSIQKPFISCMRAFSHNQTNEISQNNNNNNRQNCSNSCSSNNNKENYFNMINSCPEQQANSVFQFSLDFCNYALRIFMRLFMPEVYANIAEAEFEIYTNQWFSTLFAQTLIPEVTLCVLAGILVEESAVVLIRAALAVMRCISGELLHMSDPDEVMEILSGVSHGIIPIEKENMKVGMIDEEMMISKDQFEVVKRLYLSHCDVDKVDVNQMRVMSDKAKNKKMVRVIVGGSPDSAEDSSSFPQSQQQQQQQQSAFFKKQQQSHEGLLAEQRIGVNNHNSNYNNSQSEPASMTKMLQKDQWIQSYFSKKVNQRQRSHIDIFAEK